VGDGLLGNILVFRANLPTSATSSVPMDMLAGGGVEDNEGQFIGQKGMAHSLSHSATISGQSATKL
jgi:hypothetical protein